MDVAGAMDYALSLAREHHLTDVDVVASQSESLTIRVLRGQVEKVDQSNALGMGLRVVRDGRTGLAYTERMEPEAVERALLAAAENATLQDPTEVLLPEPPPAVPDPATLDLYRTELERLTVDDLAAFGLEAEAAAKAADKRVRTVTHMAVSRGYSRYCVRSTHGVAYEQRQNSVGAYCGVLLEQNGQRKSGGHSWSRREWDPAAGRELGREATERGAALLGAKPIAGGKLPVVLDEYCAPQLLGMYFGAFSGEAAQKGQSRLKGRLGEQIAVPEFTLLDDPHRRGGPGSRFLDAEGTPTRPLPLIEGGVFRNFLYHVESARKDGRASTGHASRGYTGGIGTRTHNLSLGLGEHDTLGLAAIPPRCLLITELEGGAGCNPLSGDISIGVQGFLVEQGRIVQPVDSVTIAGNFYELLQQIRGFGNACQPNLSSVQIPALLVEGFTIAA